jgi:hypothetical protein
LNFKKFFFNIGFLIIGILILYAAYLFPPPSVEPSKENHKILFHNLDSGETKELLSFETYYGSPITFFGTENTSYFAYLERTKIDQSWVLNFTVISILDVEMGASSIININNYVEDEPAFFGLTFIKTPFPIFTTILGNIYLEEMFILNFFQNGTILNSFPLKLDSNIYFEPNDIAYNRNNTYDIVVSNLNAENRIADNTIITIDLQGNVLMEKIVDLNIERVTNLFNDSNQTSSYLLSQNKLNLYNSKNNVTMLYEYPYTIIDVEMINSTHCLVEVFDPHPFSNLIQMIYFMIYVLPYILMPFVLIFLFFHYPRKKLKEKWFPSKKEEE